jgi:predicted nucleotidyltransferase
LRGGSPGDVESASNNDVAVERKKPESALSDSLASNGKYEECATLAFLPQITYHEP